MVRAKQVNQKFQFLGLSDHPARFLDICLSCYGVLLNFWSFFLYLRVLLHDTPSLVLFIDACERSNRECLVVLVGLGDLSCAKFDLVYYVIFGRIS